MTKINETNKKTKRQNDVIQKDVETKENIPKDTK